MDIDRLAGPLAPFFLVRHPDSVSLCLDVGEYKRDVFEKREDEGFEGNGYDWASLARVFLKEKTPELGDRIQFDPEAGMFCAYSDNESAIVEFALSFKRACEDDVVINELFSRAELD